MRLRMILFAAFGVVLLAAIGIVVALATLDFGRFKGPIAAQLAHGPAALWRSRARCPCACSRAHR